MSKRKETYTMKRHTGEHGAAIAEALVHLQKQRGSLRADDVVDIARDPRSPLHRCFDWDDTTAAHKWRLSQASKLIREVEVSWAEPKGPRDVEANIHSTRAFVNTARDGSGYEPIQQVLSNEEKRLRLLELALEDLLTVQNRYQALQELAGVRVAIGEFAKKVNDYERRNVKKRRAA